MANSQFSQFSNARPIPGSRAPSRAMPPPPSSGGAAQPFTPGTITSFGVPVAGGTAMYHPTSPRELAALERRFPHGKVRVQARAEEPPAPQPSAPRRAAPAPAARQIIQPRAATGVSDANKRIRAIVRSEHAVGREAMAEHLAFDTDLSAAEATAVLAKAPRAAKQASNPKAGSDHPTQRILANYRAVTGQSPRPSVKAATLPSHTAAAGDAKVASILANHRAVTGAKQSTRA